MRWALGWYPTEKDGVTRRDVSISTGVFHLVSTAIRFVCTIVHRIDHSRSCMCVACVLVCVCVLMIPECRSVVESHALIAGARASSRVEYSRANAGAVLATSAGRSVMRSVARTGVYIRTALRIAADCCLSPKANAHDHTTITTGATVVP